MAEDSVVHVSFDGKLEPASPSLQNCIKFSNSGRYFSALCDFGAVSICQLTGISEVNFGNKIRVPQNVRLYVNLTSTRQNFVGHWASVPCRESYSSQGY